MAKFSRSDLISVSQVALLTGRSDYCVRRAIRLGWLPTVRRRGRLMVPACVIAHLANRPVGGASL